MGCKYGDHIGPFDLAPDDTTICRECGQELSPQEIWTCIEAERRRRTEHMVPPPAPSSKLSDRLSEILAHKTMLSSQSENHGPFKEQLNDLESRIDKLDDVLTSVVVIALMAAVKSQAVPEQELSMIKNALRVKGVDVDNLLK